MVFRKKVPPRRTLKNRYTRKYNKNKFIKKKFSIGKIFVRFVLFVVLFLTVWGALAWIILYQKYLKPLPSVNDLGDLKISEASIIYDREWNELYKIYKENRTYIDYEKINKNMVNALVAWEDKRFFVNPWIDFIWMVRAVLYYAIGKSAKIEWTSTISQQLIRNTVITNERSIERKIKEMYLSYKINKWLSKEKILELYLNKIEFWSNAYGIEQASKTFFGKSAKDLWILESSILASLPKWPSEYSPYRHPDRLLWYPYTYSGALTEEEWEHVSKILTEADAEEQQNSLELLENYIDGFSINPISDSKASLCWLDKEKMKNNLTIDSKGCSIIDYSDLLNILNAIRIKQDNDISIEYQTWRKDFILQRMLEDNYINFDEYKKSLIDSFAYKFEETKEKIKYPHFVFYVKEYLEEKYGEDMVARWGLRIYTTIDPVLQDKAEELVAKQAAQNERDFWAKDAALISLNNETGEIVAMVWSRDYFDVENMWNVNAVTSRLQPWSTFKPFVYALAIQKNPIWDQTPVFDLKTSFSRSYTPNNFDFAFMWKMTIAKALNHSRNIPALKMFYMAWWEEEIINFMKKLWVDSLWDFKKEYFEKYQKEYNYSVPMALGTWLMTPLEMAKAYSVFANMWQKKEITPILRIEDTKWLVIEELKKTWNSEEVMSPALAYIMNNMLSNPNNRPPSWNGNLTLSDRPVAAKTWTSTKEYGNVIKARNLWTMWYTPQLTTVVWAWNNSWKEVWFGWSWYRAAWNIWKPFMEFAHKWKAVKNWTAPSDLKTAKISSISWLLPAKWAEWYSVSWMFVNLPVEYDNSFKTVQVDILCNWKVTKDTPQAAIQEAKTLTFHSLKPDNPAWENPVQARARSWAYAKEYSVWSIVIPSNEVCKRTSETLSAEILTSTKAWATFMNWSNYIEIWYKSPVSIIRLDIYVWDTKVSSIKLSPQKAWLYRWNIDIPSWFNWSYNLTIKTINSEFYESSKSIPIIVNKKVVTPPEVSLTNPPSVLAQLNQWETLNIQWSVKETGWIKSINIYVDSKPVKIWITDKNFSYSLGTSWFSVWKHLVRVEAINSDFMKWTKDFVLEILE